MLHALRPLPAFITNRIGDFLAWNPSGLRLLAGLSDWPEAERKAARFGFLHPAARDLYVDWELTIEYQVLRIEGEGGLTMMTYHAEEGSPEYDAFVRLDS